MFKPALLRTQVNFQQLHFQVLKEEQILWRCILWLFFTSAKIYYFGQQHSEEFFTYLRHTADIVLYSIAAGKEKKKFVRDFDTKLSIVYIAYFIFLTHLLSVYCPTVCTIWSVKFLILFVTITWKREKPPLRKSVPRRI